MVDFPTFSVIHFSYQITKVNDEKDVYEGVSIANE